MGSGVQAQFHTNLQKPDAGHFNAGGRWTAKSLQELLSEFFFDDLAAIGGDGRIIGGLRWTVPLLTIQVDLAKGAIAWKHVPATSGLSSVVNGTETVPTTVFALIDAISVGIADNVSGSERIDIIVADWTLITDRQLSMPQKIPTAPINQNTRWSASAAISIVQGVPAAGPPSVAVNQQELFNVVVPDGTTAANFDVNSQVRELSTPAAVSRVGPGATGYEVGIFQGAFEVPVITAKEDAGGVLSLRHRMRDLSALDPNNDSYPRWRRSALSAGESTADLFPLVSPSGREWIQVTALDSMSVSAITAATDVDSLGYHILDTRWVGTRISHLNNQAHTADLSKPLLVDARGLQVLGGRLNYFWKTAPAAGGSQNWQLLLWDASVDAIVALTNPLLLSEVVGAHQLSIGLAEMLGGQPVIEDGDILIGYLTLTWANSNDTAQLDMQSFAVDVREARQ